MECVGTRIPYAKWRLSAFQQLLATSHQAVNRGISTSRQSAQLNKTTPAVSSSHPSSLRDGKDSQEAPHDTGGSRSTQQPVGRNAGFAGTATLQEGREKTSDYAAVAVPMEAPTGPCDSARREKIIWSENTPEIMLRSMRAVVVKKLSAVLEKYKRVGTPNGVWRALDLTEYSDAALKAALGGLERFDHMQCGGVLLLDPKTSQSSGSLGSVALIQNGSKVPVFDLTVLLSESDINNLRGSHGQFQHTALFFRPKDQLGVDAMISLWKIKRLLDNVDLTER
ncbi:hypothetical protein N7447_008989 [Penicillium robsamsonii]|uniref:uncharacterized protein n=1 Tax=Penicillium robsamsonii TaxID=1792511 RepID=UPI002548ACFF|nr:uncharacterized protein N7447_008989 [Penicillium robsamsonii]KAJ5816756.1 hypothetical protein N7447_008989 [Penicillium robsamsonii]